MTSYCKSIFGKKSLILGPIFGKSHETPDLTAGKSCGYPWIVNVSWDMNAESLNKRVCVGKHMKNMS